MASITKKNTTNVHYPKQADMSRNQALAGQTVQQGNYTVSYDENGYATKAVDYGQLKEVTDSINRQSNKSQSSNTTQSGAVQQSDSGSDLSDYLKEQAAARLESDLANLKYAYQTNMNDYDVQKVQIPKTYAAAKNQTAAQNALEKKSFDERAAGAGLSSGAGAQAELARSSAYQRDMAGLEQAQADALSRLEQDRANLTAQYQNAVAQIQADNRSDLAQNLYQELLRQQEWQREDALRQQEWQREDALRQQEWQREDALRQAQLEAELAAQAQKLAQKYASTASKSAKYDNGSLTAQQVKAVQGYFGLTQDGYWGPESKSTTGLTADKAWDKYINSTQYLGSQQPETTTLTSASYFEDEGIVVWNGTAYSSIDKLKKAIKKANLPQSQLEALERTLQKQGVVITL